MKRRELLWATLSVAAFVALATQRTAYDADIEWHREVRRRSTVAQVHFPLVLHGSIEFQAGPWVQTYPVVVADDLEGEMASVLSIYANTLDNGKWREKAGALVQEYIKRRVKSEKHEQMTWHCPADSLGCSTCLDVQSGTSVRIIASPRNQVKFADWVEKGAGR